MAVNSGYSNSSTQSVQNFVNQLTNDESIIRLNHMGFCYKVDSQKAEKERLAKLMKSSKFNLYQESSGSGSSRVNGFHDIEKAYEKAEIAAHKIEVSTRQNPKWQFQNSREKHIFQKIKKPRKLIK